VTLKWCFRWPHCSCGIEKGKELLSLDQKMLVYRDGAGDMKRVPVSELIAYAITEELQEGQMTQGCPRVDGQE